MDMSVDPTIQRPSASEDRGCEGARAGGDAPGARIAGDSGGDSGITQPGSSPSLARAAMDSGKWTLIGFGAVQVLRLVSNLVMAKLLAPQAFGLMAMVGAVLQGLQMLSDIGIGPSIIQSQRGEDRAFLNTAWTLQALRGAGIWGVACLLSIPLAAFYAEPMLWKLIPVVALTAVVQGLNSTALFTLNRRMSIAGITLLDVLVQVLQVGVMIAWALGVERSVWALIAGGFAASIARAVISHYLVKGPSDRPRLEPAAIRSIISFGGWIFLSTLLTFFALQGDKFLIAKRVSMSDIGVYAIALMFVTIPLDVIRRLGEKVAFPAYSRVINDGGEFAPIFARIRFPLCSVGAMLVTGAASVSPDFLHMVYDTRYDAARDYIPLMGLGCLLLLLETTSGMALLSLGRAKLIAAGSLAKLVGLVVFVPLGFRFGAQFPGGALQGAVLGVTVSELLRYLVSALSVRSMGLPVFLHDLSLLVLGVGAYFASGLVAGLLGLHEGTLASFLVRGVVVTLCFALPVWRTGRELLSRWRA